MIESGRVIAVEHAAVWVETQQKSSCGSCSAQQVCGQNLLASLYPSRVNQLRVSTLSAMPAPELGDWIDFTVPDHALLAGSLRVYLLPLFGLILGALLGNVLFGHELLTISASIVGLVAAITLARSIDSRASSDALLPTMIPSP